MPVPSTARGRLALRALDLFAERGYGGVGVGELAAAAGVTTGSLYHHFGSKLGLYTVVRAEAEARVLDRMEGAAAARADDGPGRAALLVGFDAAAGRGFARLLAEPHPDGGRRPGAGAAGPAHRRPRSASCWPPPGGKRWPRSRTAPTPPRSGPR